MSTRLDERWIKSCLKKMSISITYEEKLAYFLFVLWPSEVIHKLRHDPRRGGDQGFCDDSTKV